MSPPPGAGTAPVPFVVPLGFHCAPCIVNDVLGHDPGRPRSRTPFCLGVFPPDSIAGVVEDGLTADNMVNPHRLAHADGRPLLVPPPALTGEARRLKADKLCQRFGHDATVEHLDYGFVFNHDFVVESCPAGETIVNYDWVRSAYEAKIHWTGAALQGQHPVVLLTIATPAILRCGRSVEVPNSSVEIVDSVRRAMRALQATHNGATAIIGAVVLVGPDQHCHHADDACASSAISDEADVGDAATWLSEQPNGAPNVAVGRLSRRALELLYLYGQRPLPEREELYSEVYSKFVDLAGKLTAVPGVAAAADIAHHWPRWEETHFFSRVVATCRTETSSASAALPPVAGEDALNTKYKKRMCRFFKNGSCHFGSKCNFAHSENELVVDLPSKVEAAVGS